jgi:DNA-binding XRE family transcriptional regulator
VWVVEIDLVEGWLRSIDEETYDLVAAAIEILSEHGPGLGRPLVDTISRSRHKNMKEPRGNRRRTVAGGRRAGVDMAKTFDDLLRERPGNPERRAAHKERMLAEVRAYKLRELREMLALTQTDVAETLEISQKRVSEIERGRVELTKVDTLRRYAEAVGGTLRVEVQIGDEIYQIA